MRKNLALFWLAMIPFAVHGADSIELPSATQEALRHAERGDLIALPGIPTIPIARSVAPGPKLLFCDMPEYLGDHNGISLEEDIGPGDYRLYIYHVPGTTNSPRTISAVIENRDTRPLTVRFHHYAFVKPGADYPDMGVQALIQFFTGKKLPSALSVAPGACAALDPKLDATVAHDPQLVHAFYEFTIDASARIAVLQRDPGQSSTTAFETLPKLPRQFPGHGSSGAGRGLFPEADFLITNAPGTVVDSAAGLQRLTLSDGRREPWLAGTDGLAGGIKVTNNGNYGMIYHVKLNYISSDGRALALLIGALDRRNEDRPKAALEVSEGIWKGGWVAVTGAGTLPAQRGNVEVVQEFPAVPSGSAGHIELIYSPPGGSSLPTPIYLAPFRE